MWERGLKLLIRLLTKILLSRSPCGSVDWNPDENIIERLQCCRSPCGSVDWNRNTQWESPSPFVAPHVGAWIETAIAAAETDNQLLSRSPCGSVDWNVSCFFLASVQSRSLPMWERGLKRFWHHPSTWGYQSLPMWERGLKQNVVSSRTTADGRSPCGSVDWNMVFERVCGWTCLSLPMWERGLKPEMDNIGMQAVKSLPMWERGLKLEVDLVKDLYKSCSPCGSVDWNLIDFIDITLLIVSLPMWERGLKYKGWWQAV